MITCFDNVFVLGCLKRGFIATKFSGKQPGWKGVSALKKAAIIILSAIPLLIAGYLVYISGLTGFLIFNGFSAGFVAGVVYLSFLLARRMLPGQFVLLSYFALVVMFLSYLANYDSAGLSTPSTPDGMIVTFGFFAAVGITLFITTYFLITDPLSHGIRARDRGCRKFISSVPFVFTVPLTAYLAFSICFSAIVFGAGFDHHLMQNLWFLGLHILAWLVMLVRNRGINYSELQEWVRKRNLGQYSATKELKTVVLLIVAIGTAGEAFRGLWLTWLLTLVWLGLMVLNLWKIWAPVLARSESEDLK
jgi:hypothetical protein